MRVNVALAELLPMDVLAIGFAGLLAIITVVFGGRQPVAWIIVLLNCAVGAGIWLLRRASRQASRRVPGYLWDWYIFLAILFYYKECYFIIGALYSHRVYDGILIRIDRWMFGTDPTIWLARFTSPPLTEIFEISYALFFVLFVAIGIELSLRRWTSLFRYFGFVCAYGFFVFFLGYLTVPAVGPRFTLHDFSQLDSELPGVLATPYLRWFINAAESVPSSAPNSLAADLAQRDVFPSGHAMMALVAMYFSRRYRLRTRAFVCISGSLAILAGVYLRYHYVVDILAGAAAAFFCLLTCRAFYVRLRAWRCRKMQDFAFLTKFS